MRAVLKSDHFDIKYAYVQHYNTLQNMTICRISLYIYQIIYFLLHFISFSSGHVWSSEGICTRHRVGYPYEMSCIMARAASITLSCSCGYHVLGSQLSIHLYVHISIVLDILYFIDICISFCSTNGVWYYCAWKYGS